MVKELLAVISLTSASVGFGSFTWDLDSFFNDDNNMNHYIELYYENGSNLNIDGLSALIDADIDYVEYNVSSLFYGFYWSYEADSIGYGRDGNITATLTIDYSDFYLDFFGIFDGNIDYTMQLYVELGDDYYLTTYTLDETQYFTNSFIGFQYDEVPDLEVSGNGAEYIKVLFSNYIEGGDNMTDIVTAVTTVGTSVATWFVNLFQSLAGIFYDSTNGFTMVGTFLLIGIGIFVISIIINWVKGLIRIR